MEAKQENIDKPGGWVEDPEPEVESKKNFVNIKWDEIGKTVEGIYSKKREDATYGITYHLDDKDGITIYSVPGTTDLNFKMKDKKIGDLVKIEFVAEEDIGKPSNLKKFKTYHRE